MPATIRPKTPRPSQTKVAILQLATLAMSDARIDYYLQMAAKEGARVVLLGEYIINTFFTELIKMPPAMVREQSEQTRATLLNLCKKYDLTIIAPIISVKSGELTKNIAKFSASGMRVVPQNILINYPHWNEAAFFKNSFNGEAKFMRFSADGVRFAVMMGFEVHFDRLWVELMSAKTDCVLLPSSCTFDSMERWNTILKARAFCNSVYILRANRLGRGRFSQSGRPGQGAQPFEAEFYGHSLMMGPSGAMEATLDSNEGMLMCEIDMAKVLNARTIYRFNNRF